MKRQKTVEELQGQADAFEFLFLVLFEEVFRDKPKAANRTFHRLLLKLEENNLSEILSVRDRKAHKECERVLSDAKKRLIYLSEEPDGD